jgi:hypothetical protein
MHVWPPEATIKKETLINKEKEFRDLIWKRDQILEEKIESKIFEEEHFTENFLEQNSNFIFSKNLIKTLCKITN